jgi:acyl-CoA synthetase (AMP-forming)/AMP-acid ligase II
MVELEGVACVADVSRVQALRRGGDTALVFEGRARTFAEVDAMASRIANALIASGLRTQERIAYLSKNTDHFLPYLLGACKARMTLTPFNFRLAAPEIARLLRTARQGSCSSARTSATSRTRRAPRSPRSLE